MWKCRNKTATELGDLTSEISTTVWKMQAIFLFFSLFIVNAIKKRLDNK